MLKLTRTTMIERAMARIPMGRIRTGLLLAAGLFLSVACRDLSEGKRPQIVFLVDGEENVAEYEMAQVIPGSHQRVRVDIELKNAGSDPLTIQKIHLLDENDDKTPKNAYVTIDWLEKDPALAIPWTIQPRDPKTELEIQVVYEPETIDTNPATLVIESDDPESPRMTVKFVQKSCQPQMEVQPPKDTFFNATPSSPETKLFQIINNGNCACAVTDIQFSKPTSVFTVQRQWPNGTEVVPALKGGDPLQFSVTYKPIGQAVAEYIEVTVHFAPDCAIPPLAIPLTTKAEVGCFEVTYDGMEKGYLDFTDVEAGEKTILVKVCNTCPANFTSQGMVVVPDDTDKPLHYTIKAQLPSVSPGGFPTPVQPDQTVALATGKCLEILVTYAGSLNGQNAQLEVSYKNPNPDVLVIPTFGGKPKSCFEFAPGTAASPTIMQFSGGKDEDIELPFVIYNCGNAPLVVKGFKIEDDFYPDKPSSYWTLQDPPAGDLEVGVGELSVHTLRMRVEDNEIKVGGSMWIDYVDAAGTDVTFGAVDLQGLIDPAGTKPVGALAGITDKPETGKPAELSAAGSTPGSEGLAAQGYLMMLLEKPAGSQVILNGGPQLPVRKFIPDKAGTYTFGLRVHSESGDFLYSDPVQASVVVE